MTTATKSAAPAKAFRFDTSTIEWKNFLTEGCYYRILDVNVAARTAEMLVKFDPGARCLNHRHVATTMSLVLEGELHVIEKPPAGGESAKVVGAFMDSWFKGDLEETMSYLAEDVYYWNVPMEPIKGRAKSRQFLAPFFEKDPLVVPSTFETHIKQTLADGAN